MIETSEETRIFYVLGATGLLGRNLIAHESAAIRMVGLSRSELDFLKPETYVNRCFKCETILDCVTVNNGNFDDIWSCNVDGFCQFVEHLRQNGFPGLYVYISTVSVLDEVTVHTSPYVRSKLEAESFLKQSGINCQIIRISYPFGNDGNPARLLPRLRRQLLCNERVCVRDVRVNFNEVSDLSQAILSSIGKGKELFVSNNQYVSLPELVHLMKDKLQSRSEIVVEPAGVSFVALAEHPYHCDYQVLDRLLTVI